MSNSVFDYFPRIGTNTAKEFPANFKWLNTKKPLRLNDLKGCVVILDFWTYCCINCMHMARVLREVEERYKGKPLVVIGVHSAKFDNETDPKNIEEAIQRYEIRHPVIVDQKLAIWHTYGVNAWPTLLIISPKGKIVHKQLGETTTELLDKVIKNLMDTYTRDGTLARQAPKIEVPPLRKKGFLSYPGKIAFKKSGKEFALSDSNHNTILVVNAKTGKVLHKIGNGMKELNDGNFQKASFFRPQGVFWTSENELLIADTENHAIRSIDFRKERVSTIAGTGKQGFMPNSGYVPAKEADLSSPWDLASLKGVLYIAMAGMNQIWRYDFETELISPYAGNGYENIVDGDLKHAEFAQPSGISIEDDIIYVADSEASGIRSINTNGNFVNTLAGSGLFNFGRNDGLLEEASFQHPLGIDVVGKRIYVADTYNSAIRLMDLSTQKVETIIGNEKMKSYCRFDDPNCDTLGLYEPSDVKVNGNLLYIADTNNNLVRTFDLKKMVLNTLKIR